MALGRAGFFLCGLAFCITFSADTWDRIRLQHAVTAFNTSYGDYLTFLAEEVLPQALADIPQPGEPQCYSWTEEEHATAIWMREQLRELHTHSVDVLALELKQRHSDLMNIVYYTNVRDSTYEFITFLNLGLRVFESEIGREFCRETASPGVPL